jgi:hypothetical protein
LRDAVAPSPGDDVVSVQRQLTVDRSASFGQQALKA